MPDISKTASEKSSNLAAVPPQVGEIEEQEAYIHDAVFGDITGRGPNYRNVGIVQYKSCNYIAHN